MPSNEGGGTNPITPGTRVNGLRTGCAQLCGGPSEWQKEFGLEFPIECVFEDGDFGRGKFIDLMRVERMSAPIFKDKIDFPGLQAADHIAWEQSNFLKKEKVGKHLPRRESFGRLLSIPHVHLQTTLESLLDVAEKKGIPIKRSGIIIP